MRSVLGPQVRPDHPVDHSDHSDLSDLSDLLDLADPLDLLDLADSVDLSDLLDLPWVLGDNRVGLIGTPEPGGEAAAHAGDVLA